MALSLSAKKLGDVNIDSDVALVCWCGHALTNALYRDLPTHNQNRLCTNRCIAAYWKEIEDAARTTL